MNFFSLIGVEFRKIRRSKILLILLVPVILMWIPSIINAEMNFDTRGIPIMPENNFFIQGFMGMVWFMIPASLVVGTVLLTQTERANKGILKMLSLPVNTAKLCLAKFTVLILLSFVQMVIRSPPISSARPSPPRYRITISFSSRSTSAGSPSAFTPGPSPWPRCSG